MDDKRDWFDYSMTWSHNILMLKLVGYNKSDADEENLLSMWTKVLTDKSLKKVGASSRNLGKPEASAVIIVG